MELRLWYIDCSAPADSIGSIVMTPKEAPIRPSKDVLSCTAWFDSPEVSIVPERGTGTLGHALAECIDIAGPESRRSPWFSATPPGCIPGGGGCGDGLARAGACDDFEHAEHLVGCWALAGMPTQHIDRFVTITASTANRSLHRHGRFEVGGAEDVVAESGERHTMFRAKESVP
jgi:hypothetical protein